MTTETHTWFQLTHDYGDYSHSEILYQSPSHEKIKEEFDFAIKQTLEEEDSYTDSLEVEKIIVTLDEDGDVDDVLDYETIAGHVFKPYPED